MSSMCMCADLLHGGALLWQAPLLPRCRLLVC